MEAATEKGKAKNDDRGDKSIAIPPLPLPGLAINGIGFLSCSQ
jgi:hypothetical protein